MWNPSCCLDRAVRIEWHNGAEHTSMHAYVAPLNFQYIPHEKLVHAYGQSSALGTHGVAPGVELMPGYRENLVHPPHTRELAR
jgi:hypothetical protein